MNKNKNHIESDRSVLLDALDDVLPLPRSLEDGQSFMSVP